MKKIVIIAIATLSTGLVLSGNLKKIGVVVIKPTSLTVQESRTNLTKNAGKPSYDAVTTAD